MLTLLVVGLLIVCLVLSAGSALYDHFTDSSWSPKRTDWSPKRTGKIIWKCLAVAAVLILYLSLVKWLISIG